MLVYISYLSKTARVYSRLAGINPHSVPTRDSTCLVGMFPPLTPPCALRLEEVDAA